MFANLKIGHRLALGFAGALAFSVLISGNSLWKMSEVSAQVHSMTESPLSKERFTADWSRNISTAVARTTAVAKSSDASLSSFFAADTAATDNSTSLPEKAKNLVKPKFNKADKDNDKTLDKDEAKAMPEVSANFDAMDTDKDGTVSRAEVKAYEKFAKKDKDADGTLDKGEAKLWWTVSHNFDAIDTDKDGTVSLAEINTYMMAKKEHSAAKK